VGLESQQALFEFGPRREVIGGEDLSLHDGKVDLNLVEPTGVDRSVNEDGVRPERTEPVGGLLTR